MAEPVDERAEDVLREYAATEAPHVAAREVERLVTIVRDDPERFDAAISELAQLEADADVE